MAVIKLLVVLTAVAVTVQAQRPFYAGSRAIGYPQVDNDALLQNRFGEVEGAPIEARGDRNLVNRLDQMPVDKRPFWYINSRQYDVLRKQPQTWPQKKSSFIEK